MLQNDEKILNILLEEKEDGNELLKHFKINYPDKNIAQESNNIYIAAVDAENYKDGLEYIQFRELVEVLVVTKKTNYRESLLVIKTVCREIIRVLSNHMSEFDNKLIFRNVTPDYSNNFVINRGHILIQTVNSPLSVMDEDDDKYRVCRILGGENIEVE